MESDRAGRNGSEHGDDHLLNVIERYDKWIDAGELSSATKVIPVRESFWIQQQILPTEQAEEILRNARSIALTNCACRTRYKHCDNPTQTCLLINQAADKRVAEGRARYLSIEEAKEVLRLANERGLVHLTVYKPARMLSYEDKDTMPESPRPDEGPGYDLSQVYSVCSCCPCCCYALQILRKFGRRDMIAKSEYIAKTDTELCTHCGSCVDRCVFGARQNRKGRVTHNPEACFGCGLCVTTCPSNAITMTRRGMPPNTP